MVLLLGGAAGVGYGFDGLASWTLPAVNTGAACRIKGNVSIETGERIYHVPGQTYYDQTVVDGRYGEHWFCSEMQARMAGWRKSRV